MSSGIYICCECGCEHNRMGMYSTAERCSSCASKYNDEQFEIKQKREAEEYRLKLKRQYEDEKEERLKNGGAW